MPVGPGSTPPGPLNRRMYARARVGPSSIDSYELVCSGSSYACEVKLWSSAHSYVTARRRTKPDRNPARSQSSQIVFKSILYDSGGCQSQSMLVVNRHVDGSEEICNKVRDRYCSAIHSARKSQAFSRSLSNG